MKNKRKLKKILLIAGVIVIIMFVAIPFGISNMIYKGNFGKRFETPESFVRSTEEFDGLKTKRHIFESNKGQQLVGYTYYKENRNAKGVVVLAHGFGGGHNSYMDVADYLASDGYLVFAYDATGNDESEGESVGGFPQGVIDLDYALRFVKSEEAFAELPIMLFGHSWGAYSVGSVLNIHKDIEAIVMVAGFNKSMDMIEEEGQRIAGDAMGFFVPYLSIIERLKFGTCAAYNCVDGFEGSDTRVMLVHSSDDSMVSFKNQYEMFYDKYKENTRFQFVPYENRGHNYVYYTEKSQQEKDKPGELDIELMKDITSFYEVR